MNPRFCRLCGSAQHDARRCSKRKEMDPAEMAVKISEERKTRDLERKAANAAAGMCLFHKDRPQAEGSTGRCAECLEKARQAYQTKGKTKCRICGETGHNSRTCPQKS